MSSIDSNGECVMHSKIDKLEIIIVKERKKFIRELFKLLLSRLQTGLKKTNESKGCVFDYVEKFI